MRWLSNDSVPFTDVVELAAHLGYPVCVAACEEAHSRDLDEFAAEYHKTQANMTDEQRAERWASRPTCATGRA